MNYGVKIKAAMRSDHTFTEATKFMATPLIIIGILFITFLIISFVFNHANAFQWSPAMMLFFISNLLLFNLTQDHLNKFFDEDGNLKN
jgi:hypothetical protein